MANIKIYTDGGARGNPGHAALGVFITNEKNDTIGKIGRYLGETTNNIAEYSAIIEGLDWAIKNKQIVGIEEIHFYTDSQLAYSQLSGFFKVKNENIREMIFEVRKKEAELAIPIFYNHIPREKNKQADLLVNLALDNKLNNI